MTNELKPSPSGFVPETAEQAAEAQLRKLRRVSEALSVRDEFLLEARRELHTAATTLKTQLKTVEGVGGVFPEESAGVIKAKAAMLAWSLDRAEAAIDHIVELANQAAAQLSVLSEPDRQPLRRPVPETD